MGTVESPQGVTVNTTVADMTTDEATSRNPFGFVFLGVFGLAALISQLLLCCVWGSLSLLGFNAFEEEE